MRTIYFTLVIVILSAAIGVLLFDKFSGAKFENGDLVLSDTSFVAVEFPKVQIRDTIRDTTYLNKTVYKKVIVPDTVNRQFVKKLISERDSLHSILLKRNVSEIAVLDTIVEPYKDSVLAVYSIYDRVWLFDFRPASREFMKVDKTHVLGRNIMQLADNDKSMKVDWKWIPTTMVLTSVITGSVMYSMRKK